MAGTGNPRHSRYIQNQLNERDVTSTIHHPFDLRQLGGLY